MRRIILLLFLSISSAWASPPEAMSWPNQGRAVYYEPSDRWLLLEGQPSAEIIAEALMKAAPGAIIARYERLEATRRAVEVEGADAAHLVQLGATLKAMGAARRFWRVPSRAGGVAFFDDQLILAADVPPSAAALKGVGVRLKAPSPILEGVWRAEAIDGDGIAAAWRLLTLDGVRYAEPDFMRIRETTYTPSDPSYIEQWHIQDDTYDGDINVQGAWAITQGDPQVVVGVFDSGFDLTHPDLAEGMIGGFDALGNDDDPSADCITRWDGRGPASSCPESRPFRESHGTAVAGVIAARADNDIAGAGICPACSLYLVRFVGDGNGRSLATAEAFQRAAEHAWLINNSWGTSLSRFIPLSTTEKAVFDEITTHGRDGKGVVILFASGNESANADGDAYSNHPGVISVGASTSLDDYACYSNWGARISVTAPSMGCFSDEYGIGTSDVMGEEGYSGDSFTDSFSGTSAACPVASGVVALMLSANPALTALQVRTILERSAAKIRADSDPWQEQYGVDLEAEFEYDAHGHSIGFGYGRVDAAAAVAMALAPPDAVGAPCDEACPQCHADRCAPPCEDDEACPGATRCVALAEGGRGCAMPTPGPLDPGQPCSPDCALCVKAIDNDMNIVDLCSQACAGNEDCPSGFACRMLEGSTQTACVPGNPQCGEGWSVRCQTGVLVEGRLDSFCSCLCIPGTDGACPSDFDCKQAYCEQRGRAMVCEETSGFGNAPVCVPREDPDVCARHSQCDVGQHCIEQRCQTDQSPGGCDVCAPCEQDTDCREGSACVTLPGERRRCAPPCTIIDSQCPEGTLCLDLPGDDGLHCVNADWMDEGYCPLGYRCTIEGHCFSDADCQGGACQAGYCPGFGPVVVEAPDAGSGDVVIIDAAAPWRPDFGEDKAPEEGEDEGRLGGSSGGCSLTRSARSPQAIWGLLTFLSALMLLRRRR
ncbi:S8 family serine peptidase [Myxococcota bacterium]|nr:S8 family serine peptidase [Myxococcota bacterium]